MPKTDFKFVSSKRDGIIAFNLSFLMLPAKIDPISEERDRKKDAFRAHSLSRVKIILALLIKEVTLYVQALIVYVGVFGLEKAIAGYRICLKLVIFLASDK